VTTARARVRLVEGLQFVGVGDSGHAVLMDGVPEHGGSNSAPRPMELLLIGLGGCTGMDAISILRKKKQHVTSLEINLRGAKSETPPTGYKDVDLEYVVRGRGIEEEAVRRAIELSMEKYCSVKATFEGSSKIGFSYRIEEES